MPCLKSAASPSWQFRGAVGIQPLAGNTSFLAQLSDTTCWSESCSMYCKTKTMVADCAVAQDEATNVAEEEELRRLHDARAMQTVGNKLFGDGNWEFASKSFANAIGYSEGEAGAGPKPASPPRPPRLDRHRPIAQRNTSQTQLPHFSTENAQLEDITRRNRLVSAHLPWSSADHHVIATSSDSLTECCKAQGPELFGLGAVQWMGGRRTGRWCGPAP